jgi:hypothetical protein
MLKPQHSFLLFLFLFCLKTQIWSQNIEIAQFPGGNIAYNRYLQVWTEQRPASCGPNSGETVIEANVLKTGELSKIKITQSSGCLAFDSICKVAVKAMPRWTPRTIDGKVEVSGIIMTIPLRKQAPFENKLKNLKVNFYFPIGTMLGYGALGKRLALGNFGGFCVAFEGKKWGIEDQIYIGNGRVGQAFVSGTTAWPQSQKYRVGLIQGGVRRVISNFEQSSLWAAVGFCGPTITQKNIPTGADKEEYMIDTSTPYFGADWRRKLNFPTFRASQTEGAIIYAQISTRVFPWAMRKIDKGGIVTISVNVGILIGENVKI